MALISIPFNTCYNTRIVLAPQALVLGGAHVSVDDMIDFGPPVGCVLGQALMQAALSHTRLLGDVTHVQLAALVFAAGAARAMDCYIPLTSVMAPDHLAHFDHLRARLMRHQNLDVRLFGENRADLTGWLPLDSRALIASHLAEVFFYRLDILERLLATPRRFRLYVSQRAFEQDGGVAGGDYNPAGECIQLLLSRMYEGFWGATPGVSPFLHEFGHMLDFFEATTGRMGASTGLLPGMNFADGAIFTPVARRLFLRGKQLELDRYMRHYERRARPGEPMPIGHPYVFQSDTEFVAGYTEMFFRNPHYFGQMNPELFMGLMELFRQDPRYFWTSDFPFYVEANRKFYLSGQPMRAPGLTIPVM